MFVDGWAIRIPIAAEEGLYSLLRKMCHTHCYGRWVVTPQDGYKLIFGETVLNIIANQNGQKHKHTTTTKQQFFVFF